MRVAVASFGSEGDIRPLLAFARGLRRAGHDAWLVASPFFASRAEEAGVPLRPAGPPVGKEEFQRMTRDVGLRMTAHRNPLRQTQILFQGVMPDLSAAIPHQLEATRDADVLVHSSLDVSAFIAALAHAKPRVSVHLFHGFLPARNAMPDGVNLGRLLNPLLGKLALRFISRMTDDVFTPLFTAAGLPPHRDVLVTSGRSPLLNLLPVSPAFVPPDPLWRGRVVQTGYWFLDMPHFEPDPELAAFLAAGEPPLVISFGSMVRADPGRTTALLCEAVERAGCRALIQAGWAGLGEGPLPPNVRRIDYVPHDWLFPRASGVIHHGGAGTTAAVLRAGVPQAVVWHLGDQPAWGKLLHKRGLSPTPPLWQGELSVDRLTHVMRALRSDPRLRGQAATVGAHIRAEDGVGQAVATLESALLAVRS